MPCNGYPSFIMIIYIPQNIDPYNTHLQNLTNAYTLKGIEIINGYDNFISGDIIPDVIHFHQIEGLLYTLKFNENLFFKILDFYKNNEVVFIYTAHNFHPHLKTNKHDYYSFFSKFIDYVDIIIHHGHSSIDTFKERYPVVSVKRNLVCSHGDYLNDMKDFHESQVSARKSLNLPLYNKVILVFGQLQYKNTSFAENVLLRIRKNYKDTILLMAGVNPIFMYNKLNNIYYKINNRIINKFRDKKILIHKRFSQLETYRLFVSSNIVFLPHKTGLTTGIIPMAATLGKPFVYPDIGVFKEQAEYCTAEKYQCEDIRSATTALDKILASGIQEFDNAKWLEKNNWDDHVEQILENL